MSSRLPPKDRAQRSAPVEEYLTMKTSALPALARSGCMVAPSDSVTWKEPATTMLPALSTATDWATSIPAPLRVLAHRYAPLAAAYLATNTSALLLALRTAPLP